MEQRSDQKIIREFEAYLLGEERSAATIEKYLHDLRVFFEFMGGKEVTKTAVLEYKANLLIKYAVTSANSMIASLNSFFRFLGRGELCIKQFRMQKKTFCAEEKELTREEYKRLVEQAYREGNERIALILQTICGMGIRVSELRHVTLEAVKRGEAEVSCKSKTRTVFIVSALRKKLLKYAKEHGIGEGMIFITKKGKPLDRSNIWREMKALCSAARVSPEKVFPHNLRHLFARTFYEIEKDIAKLADILGHSSINTTRIYIITTGAEHRRKMERLRLII